MNCHAYFVMTHHEDSRNAILLRAAMDTMLDPMVMLTPLRDDDGVIVNFVTVDGNDAFFRHINTPREDYLGTPLLDTVPGQEEAGLLQAYAHAFDSGEPFIAVEVPNADEMQGGRPRLFDFYGRRALDQLVLTFRDVTDRAQERQQLEYLAYFDPLTGLHNRTWSRNELERQLTIARANGSRVGVFFLGIDNFEIVNDSLGHAAGDELLHLVGQRIADGVPDTGSCARFGSDEFLVVVPNVDDDEAIAEVADNLNAAVSEEATFAGFTVVPSVTIGVALSEPDSDASSLLRDTDSALVRAKISRRGSWQRFDNQMFADIHRRLSVEAELRTALANGEFVVFYQPIVNLTDDSVIGHEALVRWQHPERGLLGPFDFLPTAEESGLVVGIGIEVMRVVCSDIAAGRLAGSVSVNVSAVELASPRWLAGFQQTMAEHGVAADRLVVEVTETAVLSVLDAASDDLRTLRALGIGVHLDDFGTGYSSISLLRDLPVSGLKLDRRFVADLTSESEPGFAHALADGVAALMSGLNLVGIAEGIETPEQASALISQGWKFGQGYLYGRPAPLPATVPVRAE